MKKPNLILLYGISLSLLAVALITLQLTGGFETVEWGRALIPSIISAAIGGGIAGLLLKRIKKNNP